MTSGAYSLGERYDLTVEAFEDYLARLRPGGLLVVERWLQLPPASCCAPGRPPSRLCAAPVWTIRAPSWPSLRDWQVGLILVKNGALTPGELAAIRDFARSQGLDLVALPGLAEAEANQLNVLDEPLYYRAFRQLLADPQTLYASQPYDVRPPPTTAPSSSTFSSGTRPRAVLGQLGKTWQPWGGSGYFVLVALLAVAIVTSVVLDPAAAGLRRQRQDRRCLERPEVQGSRLLWPAGVGVSLCGDPLDAAVHPVPGPAHLCLYGRAGRAILLFSGLGSLAAPRLSLRWTLPLLVATILLYPLGLPHLFQALLGTPLALRLLVTGSDPGAPWLSDGHRLSRGLAWLRERAPGLIPWAWAINGCASVLASILAAMIALSAGFSWVLVAAPWPTPAPGSPLR